MTNTQTLILIKRNRKNGRKRKTVYVLEIDMLQICYRKGLSIVYRKYLTILSKTQLLSATGKATGLKEFMKFMKIIVLPNCFRKFSQRLKLLHTKIIE